MLAYTAAEDNHTSLLGLDAHVVEPADIANNVHAKRGGVGLVRVEVHHIAE